MFMNVCALALMIFIPSHSVPITGEPCLSTGYTKAWNELLHPTSIAKIDTRYGLHEGGPKFGLTNKETEWLSRVTGNVICPGTPELKGGQGSAALIGRNDLIVTNVHNVRNRDGSSRPDWSSCYFETQSRPPVKRKLKFFDPSTVFGTRNTPENPFRDYAFIRLEHPIPGVQPIQVGDDVKSIEAGDQLIMVSAYQAKMRKDRKVLPNEPIIQTLTVREVSPSNDHDSMSAFSDASGTSGASGSILLKRDATNRLVGVGIHTKGGNERYDGLEYEADSSVPGNRSFHLLIDGPFAQDLSAALKFHEGI